MIAIVSFLINPFFLHFFIFCLVINFYNVDGGYLLGYSICIFIFGCGAWLLYFYSLKRVKAVEDLMTSTGESLFRLGGLSWRLLGYLVVIVGISELAYFGVPLLGVANYAEYGFPFLHHIAVFSWVLLFISYAKYEKVFFAFFAFLNPLLIMNRDLLLLTGFVLLMVLILKGYVSFLRFVCLLLFFCVVFGLLGQMRSGYAMSLIELPTTFALDELPSSISWPFLYLTSSTFNFLDNMFSDSIVLYEPLINVLPEYEFFYFMFGDSGFFLYFFLTFSIVFVSYLAFNKLSILLFLFLLYQFMMGVIFADKFYISHTLFVVLVFVLLGVFRTFARYLCIALHRDISPSRTNRTSVVAE